MVIVATSVPFLPCNMNLLSQLPETNPRHPSEANETNSFLIHSQTMSFASVDLRGKGDINPPSCPSFLCDRKDPLRGNRSCGCFTHPTTGNLSPVVLECTVSNGTMFKVPFCCSYRTTRMFVVNPESIGILQREERVCQVRKIRTAVKACAEYVNANGGWTICGTITRGEAQDVSDPHKKVASERVTFHLATIIPTNQAILKEQNYARLKYRYSGV